MAEQDEYAKYRHQDWSAHTDAQLLHAERLAAEYVADADACGDLASGARWEAVGEGIRLEWQRRVSGHDAEWRQAMQVAMLRALGNLRY